MFQDKVYENGLECCSHTCVIFTPYVAVSQVICGKSGPDSEELSTRLFEAAVRGCAVMVPCLEDSSPASYKLASQALDSVLRPAAAAARATVEPLWSRCFLPCFTPTLVLWWRDFMVHLGRVVAIGWLEHFSLGQCVQLLSLLFVFLFFSSAQSFRTYWQSY